MMDRKIVIVNYGLGNLSSIINAFHYWGANAFVSDNIDDITSADAFVLPGVGGFDEAMKNLKVKQVLEPLTDSILYQNKPCLGICLGMQLFFEHSTEGEGAKGLGWIKGAVQKMKVSSDFRLPHVGWNNVSIRNKDSILKDIRQDTEFYFDHSYIVNGSDGEIQAVSCYAEQEFVTVIRKGMIWGTQFHPEKSQKNGLLVYKNYLDIVASKQR